MPALTVTPQAQALLGTATIQHIVNLREDQALWDLHDIERELCLNRTSIYRLYRVTRNYLAHGVTEWPPTKIMSQRDFVPRTLASGGLGWWPPHFSALPPPDVDSAASRPRWRAGRIRTWAMQVGRMTVDGTPVRLTGRGHGRAIPQSRLNVDWINQETHAALVNDETLWAIDEIWTFFQVSETVGRGWEQAAHALWTGTTRTWPPPRYIDKQDREHDEGLRWWPPHRRVLPPPDAVQDDSTDHLPGRYLWKAGTIKRWGMQVGRVDLTGKPVPLFRGHSD